MIFSRVEIAATVIALVLCFLLSNWITSGSTSCTVVISGESITIRGCTWDESFTEYAKGLKVAVLDLP